MTDDEMIAALRTKGWRIEAPINQETCKHPNTHGFGSCSSDGSSHLTYHCQLCGKRWETHSNPVLPAEHAGWLHI